MADSLSFLISLEEKISGPAKAAGGSLEQLQGQLRAQEGELANLERAMKRLQSGGAVDIEQYSKLQSAIDEKKSSLNGLTNQIIDLGKAGSSGEAAAGGLEQLLGVAKGMGGPLGSVASGIEGISGSVSSLAALGPEVLLMAVAAAAIALAAALAAAFVGMAKFALAQADSRRSMLLNLEAILGSADAAGQLEGVIDDLANTGLVTSERLEQMAKALATAGLRGKELEGTLRTLATVESTIGGEAADKLRSIIEKSAAVGHFELPVKQLAGTGVALENVYAALSTRLGKSIAQVKAELDAGKISIADGVAALNEVIEQKLGDVAAKKALAFSAQMEKLSKNMGDLFEEVDIEPFLKGLQGVLGVFDDTTAAGQALKLVLKSVFDGVFAAAGAALPAVTAMMKEIIIAGLEIYIAVKPIASAIASFFGASSGGSAMVTAFRAIGQAIGFVVKAAVLMMTITATIVGGAIALLVGFASLTGRVFSGAAEAITGAFAALGSFFGGIASTIAGALGSVYDAVAGALGGLAGSIGGWLSAAWQSLVSFVDGFRSAGSNIMAGLVEGITAGAGAILSALLAPVQGGINAVKSLLGIHSPSRVFAEMGSYTAEGFAQGVDAGSADVGASVASMVTPPKVPGATGAKGAGAGAMQVTISIDARGAANPGGIREAVIEAMTEAAERMNLQLGVA